MNTLFAWPISWRTPSTSTASNGEPVATIARPSVQRRMSIGRRLGRRGRVGERQDDRPLGRRPAIARRTGFAERAADPGRADQDGRSDPLDRLDEGREFGREAVAGVGLGRQGELAFRGVEILAPVVDQPARVDQHERPADGGLLHPVVEHREPDEPRDPDPGRARADQHDARVAADAVPRPAVPARIPASDDGRRALDVVVERRHAIPVAVEDAQGVGLLEVLPLDDAARPDLGDTLDERLDQRVVLRRRAGAAPGSRGTAGRRAAPGCRSRRRARPAGSGPDGCRRRPCTARACRSGSPSRPRPGRRGRGSARCRSRR